MHVSAVTNLRYSAIDQEEHMKSFLVIWAVSVVGRGLRSDLWMDS